jgi:excisionase family DNA binding protein
VKHTTDPLSGRRRLVNLDAAADVYSLHPRTIRRMISRGQITGYRVGPRVVRVDLDEIDAAITTIPAGGSGEVA